MRRAAKKPDVRQAVEEFYRDYEPVLRETLEPIFKLSQPQDNRRRHVHSPAHRRSPRRRAGQPQHRSDRRRMVQGILNGRAPLHAGRNAT